MVTTGQCFACKSSLLPSIIYRSSRFCQSVTAEAFSEFRSVKKSPPYYAPTLRTVPSRYLDPQKWKKFSSKDLGIKTSVITKSTNIVLNALKRRGYEVYLVGGCVRDLILKRMPKDFDIITSALLSEVMRIFLRCEIVGKRFPICHVHVNGTIIEVSSFTTFTRKFISEPAYFLRRPPSCRSSDYRRWKNCLKRDFTINSLMFDPYAGIVYDYLGGMEDIRKAKVRTVIPAHTSFQEDYARILRAVRLAARLDFQFASDTALFVKDLSYSVLKLDKARLFMEMNYMLAFGSAEASLRLLWRFGLLDILLPFQAAYFASQSFTRRDERSNMLLAMFSTLDMLVAVDKPGHSSLWVGILAFHKALFGKPRTALVIAAFALSVHNGDKVEAVNIAKTISKPHANFSEILESNGMGDSELVSEVLDLASAVKISLAMMMDESCVSQAMAEYPQAPYSNLVFIPLAVYMRAHKIFDGIEHGKEKGFIPKQVGEIDYNGLAQGQLQDICYVFAHVVFDTLYPSK